MNHDEEYLNWFIDEAAIARFVFLRLNAIMQEIRDATAY